MHLRLKQIAKERGIKLISIARKIGLYRSNLSAIASGRRGVSLRKLIKICQYLNCSLDELIFYDASVNVYDKKMEEKLSSIEKQNFDGMDKSWVNKLMAAQTMHYKKARNKQ